MINLTIQIFWCLAGIFGICEFGQQLCGTFGEINDIYDLFAWYLFPYKAQHMLTTLIIFVQRPVELHVIGSITCSRITFQSVRKSLLIQNWTQLNSSKSIFLKPFCRFSIQHIHGLWYFGVLINNIHTNHFK